MTWLLYENGELTQHDVLNQLSPSFEHISILHCDDLANHSKLTPGDSIITYVSLETLRNAVKKLLNKDISLAVLPREDNRIFTKAFKIPQKFDEALNMILNTEPSTVDILDVNGLPVFSYVTMGKMSQLRPKTNNGDAPTLLTWVSAIKESLCHLKELRFQAINIKTAKGQQLQTASMGITLIENHNNPVLRHVLENEFDSYDGRLNAFIWAPKSVVSLLWYWIKLSIFGKISTGALPDSIGFIQTTQLQITSSHPIEFSIDGTEMGCKFLEACVIPGALKIIHGNAIPMLSTIKEEKESFKVSYLPRGEAAQNLVINPLPFFSHAGEEDFRELFLQLRQSAQPSHSFFTLMILSTILAAMGLFLNSSSVIIGAMILAPLMAPIISLAMATTRSNKDLMLQSLKTLGSGIAVSIAIAALISAFMPLELITPEMRSRLNPNLLDLMVAIVSGAAGAYAHAREDIAKSLAGVAIAVALVPPLTVAGIGLGFADFQMVSGSFLLFATNLIGIVIAATLTFLVLGFAPLRMAKKGLIVTGILLLAIIPPLTFGFLSMTLQSKVAKQLINYHFESGKIKAKIENATVIQASPLEIELKLSVNEPLEHDDFDTLKSEIVKVLRQDLSLRISYEIIR